MESKDKTAVGVVIITYFINTLAGSIFALSGNRWVNSLIFPIIPTAQ